MLPGSAGQAADGVLINADKPPGGADAAALVQVLEDGEGLLLGEMAVEEGRPLALGEAVLAGVAVKQSDVVLVAVAGADREIAGVAAGIDGAVGVLAAEAREVVHAAERSGQKGSDKVRRYEPDAAPILRCSPAQGSVILRHDRAERYNRL
jgi:hypothetical protein